ncbi:hypothetical protein ACFLZ1_00675 [Patescibacteria group bacterium]
MKNATCCQGLYISKGLFVLSLVCVVLAAIGATGVDIYLASTQWILMAVLFVAYSLWFKKFKN